jgi:hypothetical protein
MLLSLGVSDGYSYATEKSERWKALLSVVEPLILNRHGRSFEDPGCVEKIIAVHLEVDPTLPCIEGNAHRHGVYTAIEWVSKVRCVEPSSGRLFAMVVNPTAHLRHASQEEINSLRGKKRALPLFATWSERPVGLAVYRSIAGEKWTPPLLGDMVQFHVNAPIEGKDVRYHVVAYQNSQLESKDGEVAIHVAKGGE